MKKLLTLLILLLAGISNASELPDDGIIIDAELEDYQDAINGQGTFVLYPTTVDNNQYFGMLSRIPGRAAIMGSSPIRMLERIPVDLAPYTIFDFYPQLPKGNDYSGEIEIENYIFCKFYNPQPNVDDSQNGMNCIVNTIAYGAFANCVNLTGVKLPTHLTEIRPAAFAKCASLKKIDGSECRNVRIYPFAFDGCTSLTSADLTFVSRVSYYGGKSFDNCPNLQHVILKAEKEEVRMLDRRSTPSLKTIRVVTEEPNQHAGELYWYDPFFQEEYQNAILIVPDGSKEKYQTALPWKNFANIMTEGEYAGVNSSIVGKEIVNLDGKTASLIDYDATAEIFDATGLKVADLTSASPEFSADFPGIFIIRSGANTQKVVLQ